MALHYEKITFLDGDSRRSVFLRVERDGGAFVNGIEVDRDGEEIAPPGHDQRRRIIDKTVITSRRRYVMDNHYGMLTPAAKVHGRHRKSR